MLKLIDANLSADLLSPKDSLFVSGRWQCTSENGINQQLFPFVDFDFGYQRIVEPNGKKFRITGDYVPQISQIKLNEIVTTTANFQIPNGIWGGSYYAYLGFCDKDGVPIDFIGENNTVVKRQCIGYTDISWTWGRAVIDVTRKPIDASINPPDPYEKPEASIDNTLTIEDDVKVRLNKGIPIIENYSYADFSADCQPMMPEIVLRNYDTDVTYYSFVECFDTVYSVKSADKNRVIYSCGASVCGELAVTFELSFYTAKNTLYISVDSYSEHNGFEFIEIRYYQLASLSGSDAKMAELIGGGREVELQSSRVMRYSRNYDIHNSAAVYNSHGMIVLEDFCLDNKIHTAVDCSTEEKFLAIGSTIAVKAAATGTLRSVDVPRSALEISVFTDEYGAPGWLSFCKYLRRNLKGVYRDIHKNALHYAFYAGQGPEPFPWQVTEDSPYEITRLTKGVKFNEMLPEIEKMHNILDGYHQIPYIYGYHTQNDENYRLHWDVFTADKRAGTLDELRTAVSDAHKYNTDLVLYENYDDVYKPTVDEKFAAMDMFGEPYRGWFWADGMSTLTSYRSYAESGELQNRVKKMMEVYGPRRTGYVDVLSSEVLRWDFNPLCPSSAQTSYHYKCKLIEEYNKHGMDVYSETLVHPFVGKMGYALHTRTVFNTVYYENEKFIPMMNAIYHGTIGYNDFEPSRPGMLRSLLTAGNVYLEFDAPLNYSDIKWVYLQQMPLGLIEDEYLEGYAENGGVITLTYTNNSYIKINQRSMEYEIVSNGTVIGKNWTTFVPSTKGGGYVAYSLSGGIMEYDLPADSRIVRAQTLTFEGAGHGVDVKTENGRVIIDMPADTPVKITISE